MHGKCDQVVDSRIVDLHPAPAPLLPAMGRSLSEAILSVLLLLPSPFTVQAVAPVACLAGEEALFIPLFCSALFTSQAFPHFTSSSLRLCWVRTLSLADSSPFLPLYESWVSCVIKGGATSRTCFLEGKAGPGRWRTAPAGHALFRVFT